VVVEMVVVVVEGVVEVVVVVEAGVSGVVFIGHKALSAH